MAVAYLGEGGLCLPPPLKVKKLIKFNVKKIVLYFEHFFVNVHLKRTPRAPPFQISKYATASYV